MCAIHAKRVTIIPKDMILARRIRAKNLIFQRLAYLIVGWRWLSALFGDSFGGELVLGRRLARRRAPVLECPGHGGGGLDVTQHSPPMQPQTRSCQLVMFLTELHSFL